MKEVSNEDANALAREYLRANYADKFEKVQVLRAGTSVRVSAQTQVQLAFGTLMGYSQWPVVAASSADVAFASYEIALVLDTTGSMKGGKLVSMKDAVLGLIDTMSLDVKDDKKLQFAMVPFAAFVNVGAQYGPSFDKNGDQLPGTGAEWLPTSAATRPFRNQSWTWAQAGGGLQQCRQDLARLCRDTLCAGQRLRYRRYHPRSSQGCDTVCAGFRHR